MAASEVRCNGCRGWFDAKLAACPGCETERPGFNKWLKTARLNEQLFGQVAHAEQERAYAHAVGL